MIIIGRKEVRLCQNPEILEPPLPRSFKIDVPRLRRRPNPIGFILNIIGFELIFIKMRFPGLFIQIRHIIYIPQGVNVNLAFLRIW